MSLKAPRRAEGQRQRVWAVGQALSPEDESEAFTEQKASHRTSLPAPADQGRELAARTGSVGPCQQETLLLEYY